MVVGEDVKSDVGSGAHPPSFDIVKFMGAQARQHNPGIFLSKHWYRVILTGLLVYKCLFKADYNVLLFLQVAQHARHCCFRFGGEGTGRDSLPSFPVPLLTSHPLLDDFTKAVNKLIII
jgi:hypothetical protein